MPLMFPDAEASYADWLAWSNTPAAGYIESEFTCSNLGEAVTYVLLFDPVSHETTLAAQADLLNVTETTA